MTNIIKLLILLVLFIPPSSFPWRLEAGDVPQTSFSERIGKKTQVTIQVIPSPSEPSSLLEDKIRKAFEEGRRVYREEKGNLRKAHAIDRMAELLKTEGYSNFMIRSGEVARAMGRNGREAWRLDMPDSKGRTLCRLSLESAAVAGAVRPLAKKPLASDGIQALIVVAKNAATALDLSTTGLLADGNRRREILSHPTSPGEGAIIQEANGKITTVGDVTAACLE